MIVNWTKQAIWMHHLRLWQFVAILFQCFIFTFFFFFLVFSNKALWSDIFQSSCLILFFLHCVAECCISEKSPGVPLVSTCWIQLLFGPLPEWKEDSALPTPENTWNLRLVSLHDSGDMLHFAQSCFHLICLPLQSLAALYGLLLNIVQLQLDISLSKQEAGGRRQFSH